MSHRLKNPINTECARCGRSPCILSCISEDASEQDYFCSIKCAQLFEDGEVRVLWRGNVEDLADRLVDTLSEEGQLLLLETLAEKIKPVTGGFVDVHCGACGNESAYINKDCEGVSVEALRAAIK